VLHIELGRRNRLEVIARELEISARQSLRARQDTIKTLPRKEESPIL